MEARLDCALFQLTPTRTRCDLVIFYGGKSEKLASGLFQPFVSHLKYVKDEISRAGYSITLRPPTQMAPWFTKSTFQRFVRFVSTPAVLERFVSIEKEILQIESSVQLEEGVVSANQSTRKSTGSLKKRGELEEAGDVESENSKVCLRRLLETRVALLRKQQAMAYARGLVAGFEIYNMDDLISFSDAFGASRLREACINFKELYKQKHKDGLWIQEVAAAVACSSSDLQFTGASEITLTNESEVTNQNVMLNLPNGGVPTSEKIQAPMPLPNQNPQYFYGSLGHSNQLPPYHGYPFPTMQSFPPHYPRNMQWPPSMDEASYGRELNYHRTQKSSSRRKKKNKTRTKYSGEGNQTESSDSTSVTDSDSETLQERKHSDMENSSKKKFKKKSSRKVVIQNINYITPKRRDGNKDGVSDESFSDEKTEKAEVLDISHESHSQEGDVEKSRSMFNGSSSEDLTVRAVVAIDVQDGHFIARSEGGNSLAERPTLGLNFERTPNKLTVSAAADPLVMMERNGTHDHGVELEDFRTEENFSSVMERKDCAAEDILLLQRSATSETENRSAFSASAAESTVTRGSRGEDWFVVNHSESTEDQKAPMKQTVFNGDCIFALERKSNMCVDDSFFIQSRSAVDDMYESPWKTEISMVNDLSLAAQKENGVIDITLTRTSEPDDPCMILERDSNLVSAEISWTIDYGADISFTEANRRSSGVETTDGVDKKPASNSVDTSVKSNKVPGAKERGKEAKSSIVRRSLVNNRPDIKSKKVFPARGPIIQKSKFEKEEEIRQKMEEMQIERQKRIAEKTAAAGFSPVAPKRASLEGKTAKGSSIKSDKSKLQPTKRTLNL
ncbi:hypothetical protein D8674_027948 [Pyrus ussuriensis x Pyrus communis]|uniref:COP1-interacting protein 7 n=1 Tax=Pyrus ussuriensis x Pyrus communis TaxID=2448454 RepID=A0A5N5IRF2_9ROSA|nr:hypothetical protein D8674_027948 [Pyrus ussuriensis x Pyrus communis]